MLHPLMAEADAPWKERFRVPVQFAAPAKEEPRRGLVVSNHTGVFQLYAWDIPGGTLRPVTDRPSGVAFGTIAPDGRSISYLHDDQGNEIGHFVRVPFDGGTAEDLTPNLPPYSSFSFAESQSGNLICVTIAKEDGFSAYAIDPEAVGDADNARRFFHSPSFVLGTVVSHDGALAVVTSTERTGKPEYSLIAVDVVSGERIAELWDGDGSSIKASMFSPRANDQRVLATTNRSGVERPLLWEPRSGERSDLRLDHLAGDVEPYDWSPDGRTLLLSGISEAIQRLYLYDLASHRVTPLEHPAGTFFGAGFRPDGEIWAHWTDSTHPMQLIALDGERGALQRVVLPARDVPPSRPWRSITFTSSDGQRIQGWLGLPDGEGPFPTVLETHGGPTWAVPNMFDPASQAWLDHGFAFLTINFRGSTTFGRDFEHQIYGDLGHWEVEDMVAARDWLIDEGIAVADQILLTGWSYGGFLTLQALGKRPDLWAGGMAGVAIADWRLSVEDAADTLKGIFLVWFGGTPEEKPEVYAASSPITYVEQVAAPLLIIQGRHDTRTPARPIEVYEQRMRELGKPIEVEWFDAGHGSFVTEQRIEHQELMLRFAYRVLGEPVTDAVPN
ncbi:MAG TPA: prolyl oligopeptidase family serine peptidase [Herpetosiphonaceae bacterium]|nr:prolyl oligopeptidase family serine peptidase [Herpetosiphonaceae bacterium]